MRSSEPKGRKTATRGRRASPPTRCDTCGATPRDARLDSATFLLVSLDHAEDDPRTSPVNYVVQQAGAP